MKKLSFLSISSVGYRKISFSYRPRINPVSIPYQSRIVLVSSSYRSPIVLVSSSYRSPIVLASGSGNNTETIRSRYTLEGRTI